MLKDLVQALNYEKTEVVDLESPEYVYRKENILGILTKKI